MRLYDGRIYLEAKKLDKIFGYLTKTTERTLKVNSAMNKYGKSLATCITILVNTIFNIFHVKCTTIYHITVQ